MNHDHMDEGNALFDEEVDEPELPESTQSGGAQSKSAKENNRVQVADEAMEDSDDEYTEEEAGPGFPAHINIIIEKVNDSLKSINDYPNLSA